MSSFIAYTDDKTLVIYPSKNSYTKINLQEGKYLLEHRELTTDNLQSTEEIAKLSQMFSDEEIKNIERSLNRK